MNTLKLILGIIAAVLCFQKSSFSQEVPEKDIESENGEVYTIVEQMPVFEGGEAAMFKYLADSTVYPELSMDNGHQGTVYLSFVVETDGSVTDVEILRGVTKELDEEAIRVVNSMNKRWQPGYQRGNAVRVKYNLPIKFILRNPEPLPSETVVLNNESVPAAEEEEIYTLVDVMPEFDGGLGELFMYLGKNTVYPAAARKQGQQGVVHVTFIIEKTGELSNFRILRGVSEDLDAEALRVVKSTNGKWTPGYHKGNPVRVQYNIPLRFNL